MNDNLIPISLPLNDGSKTLVYVNPTKPYYGTTPTSELISKYAKPIPKPKLQVKPYLGRIIWSDEPYKDGLIVNTDHTIGKGSIEQILSLKWLKRDVITKHTIYLTNPLPKIIRIHTKQPQEPCRQTR